MLMRSVFPYEAALFCEKPSLLLAKLVHCCAPLAGLSINRALEFAQETPVAASDLLWSCAACSIQGMIFDWLRRMSHHPT
jgi:hypothetical protein